MRKRWISWATSEGQTFLCLEVKSSDLWYHPNVEKLALNFNFHCLATAVYVVENILVSKHSYDIGTAVPSPNAIAAPNTAGEREAGVCCVRRVDLGSHAG